MYSYFHYETITKSKIIKLIKKVDTKKNLDAF